MTDKELLRELETLGSEQTRKTNRRHGVTDKQFGVSFANLGKLHKKIKIDHKLALGLWASGVHDARILATMIADPAEMTASQIDRWARDLSNYVLTDALCGLVSKTPMALKKAEQWTRSKDEWMGSAGWQILSRLSFGNSEIPDSYFLPYLETIEREIHNRKNRVRYAMNQTLISIGSRGTLQKRALAAAGKIGKVQVDHGETGCKTPDAAEYIRKMTARKQQSRSKGAKA